MLGGLYILVHYNQINLALETTCPAPHLPGRGSRHRLPRLDQGSADAARFLFKGLQGLPFKGMGKRGESRPEISGKVLDVVAAARAALGKPVPKAEPPRPLATPARSDAAIAGPQASPPPMSVQSTPVKSPDMKRMKHLEDAEIEGR